MKKTKQTDDYPALFDLSPYICEPAGVPVPDPSWDKVDSILPSDKPGIESTDAESEAVCDSILPSDKPSIESTEGESEGDDRVLHGCVSVYCAGGTARTEAQYFRYSWQENGRKFHRHIPGGNTGNPVSQRRVVRIQKAIERGVPPREIISKFLKS